MLVILIYAVIFSFVVRFLLLIYKALRGNTLEIQSKKYRELIQEMIDDFRNKKQKDLEFYTDQIYNAPLKEGLSQLYEELTRIERRYG